MGFQPFDSADADDAPVLYANSDRADFWEKVEQHCRWTSPQQSRGK
jgi:hypothetical protein